MKINIIATPQFYNISIKQLVHVFTFKSSLQEVNVLSKVRNYIKVFIRKLLT